MKKQSIKLLIKILLLMTTSIMIGVLLLVCAYSLPTERIKNNVEESIEILEKETDHYNLFKNIETTIQDNYSDALYLNLALVDNSIKGKFTGLMGLECNNSKLNIKEDSPVKRLSGIFDKNAKIEYKNSNRRFWNGYEVVLKPLLLFANYQEIRVINLILEVTMLMTILLLMHKRNLGKYNIAFVISYLFLKPITIAFSISFAGFVFCMYSSCIAILLLNEKLKEKNLFPLFFMVVGIITAYFNMNYFQLLSFAYPMILYYLINDFSNSYKNSIKVFVSIFLCWLFGFLGMYLSKWIVYELFLEKPIIADMITRSIYRVSATEYYKGPSISRINALLKNVYLVVTDLPWLFVEISFVAYIVIKIIKNNIDIRKQFFVNKHKYILFVLMLIIVVLRYLIFANHVYVHDWVMYRVFDSVVLFFNVIIIDMARGEQTE